MHKPLRMAVIGAGAMSKSWLDTFQDDPRWRIVALVDVDRQALEAVGRRYHVPQSDRFSNAESAYDVTEPDAALVVTPPDTHHDIILAALDRGIKVLAEKPLAHSLHAGVEILRSVRSRAGLLMVGQGRRWLPHIQTLKQVQESGLIGDLGYLTCQFHIPFRFGGWRQEMPEVLLEDLSIHHFDTIRYLTGQNGREVYAHAFRPAWSWFSGNPCTAAVLRLENDLPVQYYGSWVARGPRTAWDGELVLVGRKGALRLRADETIWHYPDESEKPVPVPILSLPRSGLALGLDRFTGAVLGEVPPEPDVEDNILSLAIVSAAIRSNRTGLPVDILEHLREAGWSAPESPEVA